MLTTIDYKAKVKYSLYLPYRRYTEFIIFYQ